MSSETRPETDQDRLRKLARIEELAAGVEERWRRVGRLSRIEEDVRELLNEIRRSAVPIKKSPRAVRDK